MQLQLEKEKNFYLLNNSYILKEKDNSLTYLYFTKSQFDMIIFTLNLNDSSISKIYK